MALIESKLKAVLATVAPAYALVLPEKASLPAIVYKRISTSLARTISKQVHTRTIRYQVDIYGDSYSQVRTKAEALVNALESASSIDSFVENDTDFNPDNGMYRVMFTVFVYSIA